MQNEFEMLYVGYWDDRPHMIIKYKGEIIGNFSGHIVEKETDCYYISYLIFNNQYKGRGIGRLIVEFIIKTLTEMKLVKYIQLESKIGTLGFWHKFGFEIVNKKAGEPNCKVMILKL